MSGTSGKSRAGPADWVPADPARLPPICPNPVFVIGSPRSGTTVLAQSLSTHSELWASGESHVYSNLFANGRAELAFDRAMRLPGPTLLRVEKVTREEFLAYLGMGINALITSRSGGRRWIDHTPLYTRIVDTLAELFPGASFIHILRDGRSVVHSMLNFVDSRHSATVSRFAEETIAWATDVQSACETWRDHVEGAMSFCDEHPDRATVVRYEELVATPQETFRRIHRFLGIADEDEPASFLASKRINSSFGDRPLSSGDELWTSWDEERRHVFAEVAAATMLKCGYSTPGSLGGLAEGGHGTGGPSRRRRRRGLLGASEYSRLVARVREAVTSDIPADARVLVATKGDPGFLDLDGRRGWHFPRDRDGKYAGHYPPDSEAAIAHLEELREQGATHLVLPETAFWWLDHYEGLREHLDEHYRRSRSDDDVIVYDLAGERPMPPPAHVARASG